MYLPVNKKLPCGVGFFIVLCNLPRKRVYSNYKVFYYLKPHSMNSYNSRSTKPLYRATQIIWALLGIIEVILAFRFLLKLFGANPAAGFTSFMYTISYPFAAPFVSVFGLTQVQGSIFEWTTLLAMLVFGLLGWGIVKLLTMSRSVSTPEAAAKLEDNE